MEFIIGKVVGFLIAVFVIGVIIFIHELGHFFFAKLAGCAVSQFSLGFGPRMFGFKRKETDYRVSWLPILGGYIKLMGMRDETGDATEEEIADARKYGLKSYEEISTWRKLSILVGGVFTQCLVCVLVLTLVIIFMGRPINSVMIVEPLAGSPAFKAGLQEGDKILSIDNNNIISIRQMIELVSANKGEPMRVIVNRSGQEFVLEMTPEFNSKQNRVMIGVSLQDAPGFSREGMGIIDYLTGGLVWTYNMTVMMVQMIWMLITGQVSLENLMGPVGMIRVTAAVARTGFLNLIQLFAMINMNLALINLLPIPAVDGGHVLMLLGEKIARRRIPDKAKNVINYAGIGFLLILMFLITFGDILKWREGVFKKFDKMVEDAQTPKPESAGEQVPTGPAEKIPKDAQE